jgi:hypothetical protein
VGLFDRLREGNVEGRREQLRGYLVEMKIEIRETKEMGGLCAEGRSFWSAEGKEELPWAAALFFLKEGVQPAG